MCGAECSSICVHFNSIDIAATGVNETEINRFERLPFTKKVLHHKTKQNEEVKKKRRNLSMNLLFALCTSNAHTYLLSTKENPNMLKRIKEILFLFHPSTLIR